MELKSYRIPSLKGSSFKILKLPEFNSKVVSEYIRWQRFRKSQVRVPTKTRSDLSFSNRKMRPQKGTGRSRMGSKSSPILRKGACAHGPKKILPNIDMNKKARILARISCMTYLVDRIRYVKDMPKSIDKTSKMIE